MSSSEVLEMDIQQARMHVSEMYSSKKWKHRVANMPDDQVIAIALRDKKDYNYYMEEARYIMAQRRQDEARSEYCQ